MENDGAHWLDRIDNIEILRRVGEKRTIVETFVCGKKHLLGHIM